MIYRSQSRVEGMNEILESSSPLVRRCSNIKSRKIPDIQCNLTATFGDFCSRHWKHPTRYSTKLDASVSPKVYSAKQKRLVTKLQRFWRRRSPFLHIRNQGPGFFCRGESCNSSDLYTFDPVQTISNLYYFSFIDSNKNLWSFDIRLLGQLQSMGGLKQNPYTREELSKPILEKIRNRLTWLRNRKYSVFYPIGADLTSEQIWKQKILDIFMKIESFGYYVSCEWFTDMDIDDHKHFYKTLYNIWFIGLGLDHKGREAIVPQYMSGQKKLFRCSPEEGEGQREHTKHWWEKLNLSLIEAFISRSPDKENNRLGATYCVMGLVAINDKAAEVFPWLT